MMTYQEIKDRLSKCEYTLKAIKNGKLKEKNNTTVEKLELLKESLQTQLLEQEKGMVVTKDSEEAEKLAKKGVNVKLTTEAPGDYHYVKVARRDYKKAIGIIMKELGGDYVELNDPDTIYFKNLDQATLVDAVMDLQANDIDILDTSIDVFGEATDINDPVLMKLRALKSKIGKKKGNKTMSPKRSAILSKLQTKRDQVMRDMEQEAEPEGGPIADKYGDMLNKIDAAIAKAKGLKEDEYDDMVASDNDIPDDKKKRAAKALRMVDKGASYDKVKKYLAEEYADYKPGTIAPKDLYYSDKHGKLVAMDDVDDKYHDRLELVYKKGDEIEGPMDENKDTSNVFALGYDLDATQYVIDYLRSKYKEGQDYELHIGRGDTHPNAVTLKNPAMEQDEELGNLLMNAGDNEETDYQAGREAEKDYVEENKDISSEHLKIIASKAGKAVVKAVHDSGDEVARAKIKDVYTSSLSGNSSPEALTVHIIYKNDSEVSYRFQIMNSALYLLDGNKDIKISDVGFKPSGEPFINTELVRNEIRKYFKQMREMNDQEFADAKEADRLANHPEKDKILAIQQLIAKEKRIKEVDIDEYSSGPWTKHKLLAYLGQADDAMIRTHDDKYLIIYNPKNGNDDNAKMWKDDSVFAVDQDGEEHEVRYDNIDGLQLEQIKENSELDKITKAKRLIKQQAPAMNKLPQDDPKRKAFIDRVKQINQKHKELLDKEDDKISGIGKDQELDEGRGDMDMIKGIIKDRANESGFSEREEAAEVIGGIADEYMISLESLKDYIDEGESDLFENKLEEATDLYDRNGIQITRFSGGDRGLMLQINIGGKYIVVPADEFNNFIRALASIKDDVRDMKLQQPRDRYEGTNEVEAKPIPDTILRGYNANVKNAQSMASALLSLFDQINDNEPTDFTANGNIKRVLKLLNYVAKTPDTETDQGGEQTAEGLDEASNSIRTPAYDEAREQFFDYLERTLDATYRNASKGATAKNLLNPNNEEFITQDILPAILKRDDQPFSAIFKQQMLGDENLRRDFVRVAIEMYPEPKITPDAVNPDGSEYMGEEEDIAHDCANHVLHEKYGHGICLEEQHTLVKEGNKHVVTHYDVFFKEGSKTVRDIPVSELKVITESHHGHKRRKK